MEELLRMLFMLKVIGDCHRDNVSTQLQRIEGFGGFRTVDNSDCSLLRPVEGIKQVLHDFIAGSKARNLDLVKKTQMPGLENLTHLI